MGQKKSKYIKTKSIGKACSALKDRACGYIPSITLHPHRRYFLIPLLPHPRHYPHLHLPHPPPPPLPLLLRPQIAMMMLQQ